MAMIPEDEIEKLKREADIAAVIRARGVELKGSERGNLLGRCPFHDDATPSLVVTPGKGLFRCMAPTCGATGNVIQFVQRFDGVSFRHAFELLKSGKLAALAGPGAPVKRATVPRLECPLAVDADDQAALRQVLDYYHARLKENPAALAYLAKRGLRSEEAIAAFKIGFVDRTLGLRLPQKNRAAGAALRARLQKLGVIRDTGHEHLRGRIVFPVIAASGEIGAVYGRAVMDDGPKETRHLYLPGPRRGLWNPAALASRELILCESIIDALTFWCAGFRHVTAAYGVEGFSEEMEDAIVAAKVERVFVAFDRDDAGDLGAKKAAERLNARGVDCLRVMFPHGQDANEYASKVTPPEKSLGLLLRSALPMDGTRRVVAPSSHTIAPAPSSVAAEAAKVAAAAPQEKSDASPLTTPSPEAAKEEKPAAAMTPTPVPTATVDVRKHEPDEVELAVGDRTYRVRGLAKNTGFESLRVSLRATCGERWHLDTLDLCSARQRDGFITAAASETALKPELLKRDLGRVLLKLEELQEARLRAQTEAKPAAPNISEDERAAALALLRDPKLLDRILADFAACGVVGEETNKLVGYLAAVSRKLDAPLAVIVQSTSAAGKTALMEAVLAFVPPEERVKYSALTGQALYYLGDADLRHKILAIVEEEGAERASYALKLLQSEGELTIASTGKDPHTGRMTTQEYRVEGPVMIFLTTTAVDIDEELLNRCLVLTVDEGREQTAAIHRTQRERETLAGLLRTQTRSQVLATHRAAQRLLRPLPVVNSYAEQLTFLDDRTRTRRDHTKYLALIRTIALLHQYQRDVKTVTHQGKTLAFIEATLDDIAAANRLAHHVLGRCLDEMPPQSRRLLDLIDRKVNEQCAAKKIDREHVLFSRRDVRTFTGWSDTQLRVHLERLVDLEYVLVHRGGRGQSFVYELIYDGAGKDGGRFLPGLLDVEKLRAAATTSGHLAGSEGQLAGGSRGQNGVNAAGSRGGVERDSSSENASSTREPRGNAHQDGASDHAAA